MNRLTRRIVLSKRFKGLPTLSDFQILEEEVKYSLKEGEILCKAEWLTVDPYMRAMSNRMKVGDTFSGGQVARVIESRCDEFPEGSKVVGGFGWRDLTVYKPPTLRSYETIYKIPEMKGLPDSYALGSLGMPGITAYFGLLNICKPKPGNCLVVSSAAGAVGSLVGQIGKIKECHVLGFAGTEDKVKWVKDLGFDQAFNYKTIDVHKTFKEFAPKGIDYYFDNVGGEFTFHVMRNMNQFGRIALCGAITTYNTETSKLPSVPIDYFSMIYKNIRMEGFMVMRWQNQWFEALHQLRDWIIEGKIKVQETVTEGFDNTPKAFIELLEGKNTGKAIVKA